MGEKALATYSYEAYLALESDSEQKFEYHDGFIRAMAGGTPEHGLIAGNFIGTVNQELRKSGKNCATFTSDVRIHLAATNRTFYPDASIVCGEFERSEVDPQALVNPLLILEVLSESTEPFDRGVKFTHYRKLPSLREYVLISQTDAWVDTYYRREDDLWEIRTIQGLSAQVALKSIGGTISMQDIYRLVPGITG